MLLFLKHFLEKPTFEYSNASDFTVKTKQNKNKTKKQKQKQKQKTKKKKKKPFKLGREILIELKIDWVETKRAWCAADNHNHIICVSYVQKDF